MTHLCTNGLQVYLSNKTGGAAASDWNVLAGQAIGNNIVNTWTHRAVVRSGSSLMFFKNGLLEYTYDIGTNTIGYSSDRPWGIGNWASDLMTTGYPYIGYIDEFRVSDIARWTESFTPPTEPYPDSSIEILPGGVIPQNYALRRRMMINVSTGLPISDLPLGALINVGTDGGEGAPNYEIADKDNLVSGGVVLVRKNIHSKSAFGSSPTYPGGTLDNLIGTTIYNKVPQKLRDKMMDVTFTLSGSGDITRKMFALTYTMAGFGNNNGVAEGKPLQHVSRSKIFNNLSTHWWLSSQAPSNYVWIVQSGGNYALKDLNSSSNGVVPAFAIPSKTPYDLTPNTDGSYNLAL